MAGDFEVNTSGADRILANWEAVTDQWLRQMGEAIITDIRLSFGSSPPGYEYVRGSVVHIASQPGYPPNIDTGTLTNSLHLEPDGRLQYQVADGVEYGIHLEDGTDVMAARPFVRPVFEQFRGDMETIHGPRLGQMLEMIK